MKLKEYRKIILQPLFVLIGIVLFYGFSSQTANAQVLSCGKDEDNIVEFEVYETDKNEYTTYTYLEIKPSLAKRCPSKIDLRVRLQLNTTEGWEVVDELTISPQLSYNEHLEKCTLPQFIEGEAPKEKIVFRTSEPGQYRIALISAHATTGAYVPIAPGTSCSIGVEYEPPVGECNIDNICRLGSLGGCNDGYVCVIGPELGASPKCVLEREAPTYCEGRVECDGKRLCQTGILGGCESEDEICIAVTGANVFTCVDTDHQYADEQCSGESTCLSYGSECTPGGTSCCQSGSTEIRCEPQRTGFRCQDPLQPIEPFGQQTRGTRCPTCYDDYGDPDVILDILYRISVPAAIILGLFIVATCGYKIMTTHGDPRQLKDAQECITSAIIGLLFIMLSVSILRLVISSIITEI